MSIKLALFFILCYKLNNSIEENNNKLLEKEKMDLQIIEHFNIKIDNKKNIKKFMEMIKLLKVIHFNKINEDSIIDLDKIFASDFL